MATDITLSKAYKSKEFIICTGSKDRRHGKSCSRVIWEEFLGSKFNQADGEPRVTIHGQMLLLGSQSKVHKQKA